MIRINDLKIQKYGVRGLSISLPNIFYQPRNFKAKDLLPTYMARINNVDCLVVASEPLFQVSLPNITVSESKNLLDSKIDN